MVHFFIKNLKFRLRSRFVNSFFKPFFGLVSPANKLRSWLNNITFEIKTVLHCHQSTSLLITQNYKIEFNRTIFVCIEQCSMQQILRNCQNAKNLFVWKQKRNFCRPNCPLLRRREYIRRSIIVERPAHSVNIITRTGALLSIVRQFNVVKIYITGLIRTVREEIFE